MAYRPASAAGLENPDRGLPSPAALVMGVAGAAVPGTTSLFTGRGVMFSSLRQLFIGLAAAAAIYGIGRAVGVTLGG